MNAEKEQRKKEKKEEKALRKEMMHERTMGSCTKVYVSVILIFSLVCVAATYVLAFVGKEQIAESLSSDIVKVIISVFVTYAIKSFAETHNEKKIEHAEKVMFKDENGNGIDDELEEELEDTMGECWDNME